MVVFLFLIFLTEILMISFQISIHFFQRVQTSTAWKPPDVHLAAKLDDLDGVVLVPMEEDDATIDDMKSGVPRFGGDLFDSEKLRGFLRTQTTTCLISSLKGIGRNEDISE